MAPISFRTLLTILCCLSGVSLCIQCASGSPIRAQRVQSQIPLTHTIDSWTNSGDTSIFSDGQPKANWVEGAPSKSDSNHRYHANEWNAPTPVAALPPTILSYFPVGTVCSEAFGGEPLVQYSLLNHTCTAINFTNQSVMITILDPLWNQYTFNIYNSSNCSGPTVGNWSSYGNECVYETDNFTPLLTLIQPILTNYTFGYYEDNGEDDCDLGNWDTLHGILLDTCITDMDDDYSNFFQRFHIFDNGTWSRTYYFNDSTCSNINEGQILYGEVNQCFGGDSPSSWMMVAETNRYLHIQEAVYSAHLFESIPDDLRKQAASTMRNANELTEPSGLQPTILSYYSSNDCDEALAEGNQPIEAFSLYNHTCTPISFTQQSAMITILNPFWNQYTLNIYNSTDCSGPVVSGNWSGYGSGCFTSTYNYTPLLTLIQPIITNYSFGIYEDNGEEDCDLTNWDNFNGILLDTCITDMDDAYSNFFQKFHIFDNGTWSRTLYFNDSTCSSASAGQTFNGVVGTCIGGDYSSSWMMVSETHWYNQQFRPPQEQPIRED